MLVSAERGYMTFWPQIQILSIAYADRSNERMNPNVKKWTALSTAVMIFGVLVCAWTASHQIPFFVKAASGGMRDVAIVGVLSGEAFALWALYRKLRYAGRSGESSLQAMLVMLVVIGLNVILSNVVGSGALRAENMFMQMYAKYVAVISFAVVIVWGKLHILKNDQAQREADATANELSLTTDIQLDVQQKIAEQTLAKLGNEAIQEAISTAAEVNALRIVAQVTGMTFSDLQAASELKRQGKMLTTQQPSIEAKRVEQIDDGSQQAQYVNGVASPKTQPRTMVN
jgi:hypothetical protein